METRKIKFGRHKGIEIKTAKIKAVITTDCGPRIAFFGKREGENLLYWTEKNLGRGNWKLMGGHRIWYMRPDADESEDAYLPDNEICDEIRITEDSITVTGKKDKYLKTRRGIMLKLADENKLSVDNFIINENDLIYSAGVWALTCTAFRKDRMYGIPLGDNSEWDCFRLVMFRKWGGTHTSAYNDPQIRFTEDMLIVHPKGKETKRMIEAPYGVIAMNIPDKNLTFIKKTDYIRNSGYPLGCNIAFYIGPDNFMVEMESMSPCVTIKPYEEAHLTETWILHEGKISFNKSHELLEAAEI